LKIFRKLVFTFSQNSFHKLVHPRKFNHPQLAKNKRFIIIIGFSKYEANGTWEFWTFSQTGFHKLVHPRKINHPQLAKNKRFFIIIGFSKYEANGTWEFWT
jgi:hypothetical protein